MKGVIFNVVQEVVIDLFDEDTWDDVLSAAGVDRAHTALGNYDDAELLAIVDAVASTLDETPDDVLRTVGRLALPKLAGRLGHDELPGGDAESFLLSVNEIIHPEVRMIYPDAVPPVFTFTRRAAGGHEVVYRSARRLDALAEGLIVGCGDLFDQQVAVAVLDRTGLDDHEARFLVTIEAGTG